MSLQHLQPDNTIFLHRDMLRHVWTAQHHRMLGLYGAFNLLTSTSYICWFLLPPHPTPHGLWQSWSWSRGHWSSTTHLCCTVCDTCTLQLSKCTCHISQGCFYSAGTFRIFKHVDADGPSTTTITVKHFLILVLKSTSSIYVYRFYLCSKLIKGLSEQTCLRWHVQYWIWGLSSMVLKSDDLCDPRNLYSCFNLQGKLISKCEKHKLLIFKVNDWPFLSGMYWYFYITRV